MKRDEEKENIIEKNMNEFSFWAMIRCPSSPLFITDIIFYFIHPRRLALLNTVDAL